MSDNDAIVWIFAVLWWSALIAELAYRNGYRNGKSEVKIER